MKIKEFISKLLNKLYVKDFKCIVCHREIPSGSKYSMCEKCRLNLPTIKNPCNKCGGDISVGGVCTNCKSNMPMFDRNIVALNYVPPITTLIHKFKYDNAKYLHEPLGEILVDTYMSSGYNVDYIIPVPMHPNRRKERGYNQVELLLSSFDKIKVPYYIDIVERTIDTPHQTNLSRTKRLSNLDGAFKVLNKKMVKGKSILIVDDVYTTGATLNELAKVLFKTGAKSVYGLVIAHGSINIPME
jgi:ComF family protein